MFRTLSGLTAYANASLSYNVHLSIRWINCAQRIRVPVEMDTGNYEAL